MANYDEMANLIQDLNISEEEKLKIQENLLKIRNKQINLMVTGATGCGKSSTINALFGKEVARIGTTPDPETMSIQKYIMDNLIIWDTPGLGDGIEEDREHARNIVKKLIEKDSNNDYLIDFVLVILDGGSRDLGTSRELINSVIIPNLGQNKEKRILVAINQCDMAMKGRYWNNEANAPEPKLIEFLDQKVQSIHDRILKDTGVDIIPIYYSAGFKDDNENQIKPYNLSKLLHYIIKYTPEEKRIVYADKINDDETVWEHNDDTSDYGGDIVNSYFQTVKNVILKGSKILLAIAPFVRMFPGPVGKIGGKIVGFIGRLLK